MIFSGDQPLFNRKYLIALVWILPIIVVLLNSDFLNSHAYSDLQSVDERSAWLPSGDTEPEQLHLFFPIGAGIEQLDATRQQFFIYTLEQHLLSPEIQQQLKELKLTPELSATQSYTRLTLSGFEGLPELAPVLELVTRIPNLDWDTHTAALRAEAQVRSRDPVRLLYGRLLAFPEPELSRAGYEKLIARPAYRVVQSRTKPSLPEQRQTHSEQPVRVLTPGEQRVELPIRQPLLVQVWDWPPAQNLDQYLSQQLVGRILSNRILTSPGARWVQQLTHSRSLGLFEYQGPEPGQRWQSISNAPLSDAEIQHAAQQFESNWRRFVENSPAEWPGILLMAQIPMESVSERLRHLLDSDRTELERLWARVQQPANSQILAVPLR